MLVSPLFDLATNFAEEITKLHQRQDGAIIQALRHYLASNTERHGY
jgi:hypothetical protein